MAENQETQTIKKMSYWWLLLMAIGAIVSVLAISALKQDLRNHPQSPLVSPPFDYTGWKTGRHDQEGLSFRYPADWKLTKTSVRTMACGTKDMIYLRSTHEAPFLGIEISLGLRDIETPSRTNLGNRKFSVDSEPISFIRSDDFSLHFIDGDSYDPNDPPRQEMVDRLVVAKESRDPGGLGYPLAVAECKGRSYTLNVEVLRDDGIEFDVRLPQSTDDFKNNQDYETVKRIIESFKYD